MKGEGCAPGHTASSQQGRVGGAGLLTLSTVLPEYHPPSLPHLPFVLFSLPLLCIPALLHSHSPPNSSHHSVGGWTPGFPTLCLSQAQRISSWALGATSFLSEPQEEEYWSGLPFSPPCDHPDPAIKTVFLASPALAGGFFTTSAIWEAQ